MWLGLELSESMAVQVAANAGTSPLTVLNVQLPFPLTALCTWVLRAKLKVLTASAILKGTVTTSKKERYALDSGVGNCQSHSPGDAYTGYISMSRIFIEEVPKAQS